MNAGLPANAALWALVEHPRNPSLLAAGTNAGVFVSPDEGRHWISLRNNMPAVPVRSLVIQPEANDLVAGTWGRGIWALDDIAALEHWETAQRAAQSHLFPPRRALLYAEKPAHHWSPGTWSGSNPPFGVSTSYWLARGLSEAETAQLEIVDSSSQVIRTLSARRTRGLHRSVWDLQEELPAEAAPPASSVNSPPPPQLVRVRPGRYR